MIIKSISYSQDEILEWITTLYCHSGFEVDPTYGNGCFYKKILSPKHKYDISPKTDLVTKADCRKLPLADTCVRSIIFDPPFIAAIQKKKGVINDRFGSYRNVQTELWGFYKDSIKEFYRILGPGGFLVVKCQDTIDSGKQYLSHVEIINIAYAQGFYPRDLFVLLAKHRIMSPNQYNQQHARKFHSYFIVFEKKKSPVVYFDNKLIRS